MKKEALNNIKQKGFDSRAQMRLLLQWARMHPDRYSWVFDVLRNHGVPSNEKVEPAYWAEPYNISPNTPSYTYVGKGGSDLEQFVKRAKMKLEDPVDLIIGYYEETLTSLRKITADFKENPIEVEPYPEDPIQAIIEYYEKVLRLLQDLTAPEKVAGIGIDLWQKKVKDLDRAFFMIEASHKDLYLHLSKVVKQPQSLRTQDANKKKLELLKEQVMKELEQAQKTAQQLAVAAANFSQEEQQTAEIEELKRISRLNLDSLLFQWTVNASSLEDFVKRSKEKLSLSKVVKTAYVDHIVRMFEGKSNKFSSIDEALSDFSERLGLNNLDRGALKKEAMQKIAQLKSLEDEGITDPKAIRYMSKSKGKHTEETGSPFALDKSKGKKVEKKLKKKKTQESGELFETEEGNNEFGDYATSNGSLQVKRLEKWAEEFGKILPFGGPSSENISKLEEEMTPLAAGEGKDIETVYAVSRYGFDIRGYDGKFPTPQEPIKAQVFRYSVFKRDLAKLINEDLRKQLSQELPYDEWITFLERQMESSEIVPGRASDLIRKLRTTKRETVGDESEEPYMIDLDVKKDDKGKKVSQQILHFMASLPVSYRKLILQMLAEGRYRQLKTAKGQARSEIFRTTYRVATIPLVDSPYPYVTIKHEAKDKKQTIALLKAFKTNLPKTTYTADEYKNLLEASGVPYKSVTKMDGEMIPEQYEALRFDFDKSGEKTPIYVTSVENTDYKLSTYEGDSVSQDELLGGLHDQLFRTFKEDAPIAWEPKADGSVSEVHWTDVENNWQKIQKKKSTDSPKYFFDYTSKNFQSLDEEGNPSAASNTKGGLHPSFKGDVPFSDSGKTVKKRFTKPTARKPEDSKLKSLLEGLPKKDTSTETPATPAQEQVKEVKQRTDEHSDVMKGILDRLQQKKRPKASIESLLEKHAASDGLYMDDRGRSFNSEEEMAATAFEEMLEKIEGEVTGTVVQQLLNDIPDDTSNVTPLRPTPQAQPEVPEEIEGKPVEEISEELPLAAELKTRKLVAMLKLLRN